MRNPITIGVLAGLLGISLIASYLSWTADGTDKADEGTAMYVASADDLQKITFTEADLTVSVERRSDELGPYLWVTTTEQVEVAPPPSDEATPDDEEASPDDDEASPDGDEASPDGDEASESDDADEPAKPEPVKEARTSAFLGNKDADELWESFAPFRAERELVAADGKDTDFGLDDPESTVEVVRRSGVLTLKVGAKTVGGRSRYVGLDDKLFLVKSSAFVDLKSAKSKLPDRRLHPVDLQDAEKVTVVQGDKRRTWAQQNKDDRPKAYWADPSTPQIDDKLAGTWLRNLFTSGISEYVTEAPADLTEAFRYEVTGGGKTWSISLLRTPGDGDQARYFVKSAYNRATVELIESRAADLVSGLSEVIAERAPAPTAPAPDAAPPTP